MTVVAEVVTVVAVVGFILFVFFIVILRIAPARNISILIHNIHYFITITKFIPAPGTRNLTIHTGFYKNTNKLFLVSTDSPCKHIDILGPLLERMPQVAAVSQYYVLKLIIFLFMILFLYSKKQKV